jgi:hypothetical protein
MLRDVLHSAVAGFALLLSAGLLVVMPYPPGATARGS